MKFLRFLAIAAIFTFIATAAQAQTAVTGTVIGANATPTGSGAFVRFRLRNFSGNVPRLTGTGSCAAGAVLPTVVQASPISNGTISLTICGNDVISPLNTYYTVEYWANGTISSQYNFIISGASFNLDTGTPISASVEPAPVLPQLANTVHAGPTGGAPAAPTFRPLIGNDLPFPSATTRGGIESIDCSLLPGHVQRINTNGTVTCSIDAGGGGSAPGGNNLNVQYNQAGSLGGAAGVDTDGTSLFTKGADPVYDALAYEPVPGYACPNATATRGSINSGSSTLTLAAADGFVNGCGIEVVGAGAAATTTSPAGFAIAAGTAGASSSGTTDTITLASGMIPYPINTVVTISGVGVSGYNGTWKIVSLIGGGTGFTYVNTASGLANSGGGFVDAPAVAFNPQTLRIASSPNATGGYVVQVQGAVRTSNVVEIQSLDSTYLSTGDSVIISGVTGCSTEPNGTFTVTVDTEWSFHISQAGANESCGGGTITFATGSTTYSYGIYAIDNKLGMSAPTIISVTNSAATLTWNRQNLITIPCQANAVEYLVLDNPVTRVIGNAPACTRFMSMTSIVDGGQTNLHGSNWQFFLQNTNQALYTTIVSGGGTTTLTLAANAGNSVTNQNVFHDDTAAINAALNACATSGGTGGNVILAPAGANVNFGWLTPLSSTPGQFCNLKWEGALYPQLPIVLSTAGWNIEGGQGSGPVQNFQTWPSSIIYGNAVNPVIDDVFGGNEIRNVGIASTGPLNQVGIGIREQNPGVLLEKVAISQQVGGAVYPAVYAYGCDPFGDGIFSANMNYVAVNSGLGTNVPTIHYSCANGILNQLFMGSRTMVQDNPTVCQVGCSVTSITAASISHFLGENTHDAQELFFDVGTSAGEPGIRFFDASPADAANPNNFLIWNNTALNSGIFECDVSQPTGDVIGGAAFQFAVLTGCTANATAIGAQPLSLLSQPQQGTFPQLISFESSTCPTLTPTATYDVLCANSTAHHWQMSNNGGALENIAGVADANTWTGLNTVGAGGSWVRSGGGTIDASTLLGNTWAAPGTIGGTTPGIATFTTLNFTSTPLVSISEGSAPGGVSATDLLYGKTSTHWLYGNFNSAGEVTIAGITGAITGGHCAQFVNSFTIQDNGSACGSGGTGTVTTLTCGNLSPLFTCSVATPSTTPAISFALSTTTARFMYGNHNGSTATPTMAALVEADLPSTTAFNDAALTLGAVAWNLSAGTITLPSVFVRTDTVNTYATHLNDFSAATIKAPVAAGFTTAANGNFGYDTTNKNWHFWTNGADLLAGIWSATPTNGDCVKATVTSSVVSLTDAGAACGSGAGTTLQTNGSNNASQTTLNFTNTTGASGINFTNPSTSVESAALANVDGGGNAVTACTLTGPSQGDFLAFNSGPTCINAVPGVGINAQTSASYTLAGGDGGTSDRGKIITGTNSSAQAYTLPQAGSSGFNSNYYAEVENFGTGQLTITPTTSTINGGYNATSALILPPGESAVIGSDNTNYFAHVSGLPIEVGDDTQTAQTTAISAKTLLAVPNINSADALLFHFLGSVNCTTTSAAATVGVSVIYTDPQSVVQTINSSVATCTSAGSADFNALDQVFQAKVGTNIQYKTTIVNTPTYDVRVALDQLGVF